MIVLCDGWCRLSVAGTSRISGVVLARAILLVFINKLALFLNFGVFLFDCELELELESELESESESEESELADVFVWSDRFESP